MNKLILALIIYPLLSISQTKTFHGTYYIGAICNDGIIIGVDSRMSASKPNSMDKNGNFDPKDVILYVDSVKKIFTIRKFAFVSAGLTSLGDKLIPYYVEKMNAKFTPLFDVGNAYKFLDTFFYKSYPEKFKDFKLLKKLLGGHQNKTPFLCYLYKDSSKYINNGFFDLDDHGFIKEYNKNMTCRQMQPIIEKYIRINSKIYKNTVGGPPVILMITPDNNFIWLNDKTRKYQFTTLNEFYKSYKFHKIKVHFTNEINKMNFDKVVSNMDLK